MSLIRILFFVFLAVEIGFTDDNDPFESPPIADDFDQSDPFAIAAQLADETEGGTAGGIFLRPGELLNLTEKIKPALVTVKQIGRDGNQRGLGSGFVINESGLIATNLHVIGEGRAVQVEFKDGTVCPVVGIHAWDRHYDLAVLRIEPGNRTLNALSLGDSGLLKQGQLIVGYGSPLGLEFSVAPGVISAIRKLEPGFLNETPDYEMIQISMPIEQGNSGGPIVNLEGEVVGVVSLRHRVKENLGFAVKSNDLGPLLDKPNPIPMNRWKTIGALDPKQWKVVMNGDWTQRGGEIHSSHPGSGFGGRALCLSQQEVPKDVFEVAVSVKLDDESGAAGLAFSADGGDRHYGFYPSNGSIRLTRFDGPDVYSWDILEQVQVKSYQPGEWNRLRIRVDGERIIGFVNEVETLSLIDNGLRGGQAGLCKFRRTEAQFKNFRIGKDLRAPGLSDQEMTRLDSEIDAFVKGGNRNDLIAHFPEDNAASAHFLEEKAREFERLAAEMRDIKRVLHQRTVSRDLQTTLAGKKPEEIDLYEMALQIARIDDPQLDLEHYRNVFDGLVEEAAAFLGKAEGREGLRKLSEFLFEENGFHGSRSEYYHHSNSYINHVIDDREGLPITLSILYIEMARRLKVEGVFGVALPGQFLVGHQEAENDLLLINVFEEGEELTRREAETLAAEFGRGTNDATFQPSPAEEIATRMLRNLIGLEIDRNENPPGALGYLNLLLDVDSRDSFARFQRAIVQAQLEKFEAAKQDIDWLLEHRPAGINYRRLQQFREALE